jgi:hypothetical protein
VNCPSAKVRAVYHFAFHEVKVSLTLSASGK